MNNQDTRLRAVGEALLQKAEAFVRTLEPEQMTPQEFKQISGFLKDLRDLSQEKEDPAATVAVEFGGEESWRR